VARHGRRAGADLELDPTGAPSAAEIAKEVVADGGSGERSPPRFDDLEAKLRALSSRDPKLAGMLEGGRSRGGGGGMKSMELALELETVRGEVAQLKRKLAAKDQIYAEAQQEVRAAAAAQRESDGAAAAARRESEARERSFREELARQQAHWRGQLDEARAGAGPALCCVPCATAHTWSHHSARWPMQRPLQRPRPRARRLQLSASGGAVCVATLLLLGWGWGGCVAEAEKVVAAAAERVEAVEQEAACSLEQLVRARAGGTRRGRD
jgi:hypothetical protein